MKNQSTIEFLLLLAGIVMIAIIVMGYFYKGTTSVTKNLVNLTTAQFNIFDFNLYTKTNGNYVYGYYYQTGPYTYNTATLGIKLNGTTYVLPISANYYLSTTGTYVFDYNSSTVPANALAILKNGNVPYVFEFIRFEYNGKNYIFIANQTELSKTN